MAIKKRTDQLPAILSGDVDNNDLMYLVHENAQAETGYDSKKILVSDVGRKLNNKVEYVSELPSFPSGYQNPLDALEYLNSKILDLYPVDSASGSIANFTTSLALPLVALKVYITAQGGGGTPSAPVAITGWDNVKITKAGKNLVNTNTISKVDIDGTSNLRWGVSLKKAGTFTINSFNVTGYVYAVVVSANGTYGNIQYVQAGSTITPKTITISSGEELRIFDSITGHTQAQATDLLDNVQCEVGSTATTYEPYSATEYTIQLGQTVYGGYVDKNTGKLVVTHAYIASLKELLWTMYNITIGGVSTPMFRALITGIKGVTSALEVASLKCSNYPVVSPAYRADKTIYIQETVLGVDIVDSSYTSADDFKNAMENVQLVYPLAVPIETDIIIPDITALVGENNIFADSGDIEVSFKQGIQEYIDAKIAETQALVL